jgi:glycosyltransferase involved in cell wall biosynthesis
VREAVRPGETGWVVPPEDPRALAAAIDELLGDRGAAARMGRRGREVALEHFTLERTIEAYVELYDRVLRRR